MSEYRDFLVKYFPLSNKMEKEDRIYNLVCENNVISEMFLKYINYHPNNINQEKTIYYKRFRDGINKLLIYLPINEGIGIYACMRYSVEQFLKFIYSIYFTESIDRINRTSYRHIKDDIRGNINITTDIRLNIEKLYTYYAKYSNDVHDKNVIYDKELTFLADTLKGENEFSKFVEKDLSNILLIVYEIMCKIFDISYNCLNVSERLQIAKLALKKRRVKILKILNYDAI